MRSKSLWLLILALGLGGTGLYLASNPTGLSIGNVRFGGKVQGYLRDRTIDFLEDIKFKDFDRASSYHLAETQKKRNIPGLIRKVFQIRHEVLDIHDYKILGIELDRSEKRARVRAFVRYRILGDKRVRDDERSLRDLEMLFYWFKQPDETWVMELESSLRP